MTAGLLDLPAPLFGAVEEVLAGHVPPLWRLGLWAALAALVSIELYRMLSPQRRIAAAAADLRRAQGALASFDGEFRDALPLMRRTMAAAGRRLAMVFPASIAAALPILALLVWLDGAYGARLPDPGQPVAVKAEPAGLEARWVDAAGGRDGAVVVTDGPREVARAAVQAPVTSIHKWRWWNLLVGNPAGYLPPAAPVERVDIDLPRNELVGVGPPWMRGWEVPFLLLFTVFALVARRARRVV
ncbi:MAG: hypothetical protein RLO51_20580 [Thalassobaculum sp.]|uniref:hypothetical protein n=1 Tax=Thalassobaculum sp. TaxID=2022740 RepID=UPI0032F0050B